MTVNKRGSYTIEAAFVLPMILFSLAAMMIVGFRSAQKLGWELQEIRWESAAPREEALPRYVRTGQAAVEGFWEE